MNDQNKNDQDDHKESKDNKEGSIVDIARAITDEFFKYLGVEAQIDTSINKDSPRRPFLEIKIETKEPRQLIGQYGANLSSLQHLLRLLISSKTGRRSFAKVDINNYKSQKEEKILDIAKSMADKAKRSDSMVILKPMNSYERKVVHLAIEAMEGVTSESMGQEPERRVVIEPSRESRVVKSFQDKGLTLDDINI